MKNVKMITTITIINERERLMFSKTKIRDLLLVSTKILENLRYHKHTTHGGLNKFIRNVPHNNFN